MQSISEILKEFLEENNKEVITINAYIGQDLYEEVPSGKKKANHSAQVLADWNTFINNIQQIILANGDIRKISPSGSKGSLSIYIDFYIIGPDGNKKDGLIDLRVSNHKSTIGGDKKRKDEKDKIDADSVDLDITVSKGKNTRFNTYEDALAYLKTYIDTNFVSSREHVFNPR